MKADKSQDVQLAKWRPRRGNGKDPVQMQAGSESRKSQCFCSAEDRKNWCSSSRHPWRKSSPLLKLGSAFLFHSGFQLIRWVPPTLGRAICFTQPIQMLFSSSNTFIGISRIMFYQMSGHSMDESSWHIKLNIPVPYSSATNPQNIAQIPSWYRMKEFYTMFFYRKTRLRHMSTELPMSSKYCLFLTNWKLLT